MADFLVRARHCIEIASPYPGLPPILIDFQSEDIGATQGTTLRMDGQIIAQFRPGTRHWGSAMDSALELVQETTLRFMDTELPWTISNFRAKLAESMANRRVQAWNGEEPEPW